jgi:CYTH domain-containing protein
MSDLERERKWKVNKEKAIELLSSLDGVVKKNIFQTYLIPESASVSFKKETSDWIVDFDTKKEGKIYQNRIVIKAKTSQIKNILLALSDVNEENLTENERCAMRFRLIDESTYIFTFKKQTEDPSVSFEFEYDIGEHSNILDIYMNNDSATIEKERYVFDWNDETVELDFFKHDLYKNTPILEIEFDNEEDSERFDTTGLPVTVEITGDHDYSNKNMAIYIYKISL